MSLRITRQIVLDTETTGINRFNAPHTGHRIIEIGAVEIIDRCLTNSQFHVYLNPNRLVDPDAFHIHGINDQFLKSKPVFSDIVNDFLVFIQNSELIIHNAPFDLGFLNNELNILDANSKKIEYYCTVIDSLKLARKIFPGQRNSLDALCDRYCINNTKRVLHSALIDAQLLANVFLAMTGSQKKMEFMEKIDENIHKDAAITHLTRKNNIKNINKKLLKIIYANQEEELDHNKYLDIMEKKSKYCLWKQYD